MPLRYGRARKRVLLCDSGPRRNAAATHVHTFLTRDGTPPDEMRRIAREQLEPYATVEVRDAPVTSIGGQKGAFRVGVGHGVVDGRRVLLCTGMVDQLPDIEGLRERWGHAVFQCPYCHGFEAQDRTWGWIPGDVDADHLTMFAAKLRGWTRDVTVFLDPDRDAHAAARDTLHTMGIRTEAEPVVRLIGRDARLEAVELAGGARVPCEALFVHPPQQQVAVVRELGLALDPDGFVKVDAMRRETSLAGVYAAGDLTSRQQAAMVAAASGMAAATMINAELSVELALAGHL